MADGVAFSLTKTTSRTLSQPALASKNISYNIHKLSALQIYSASASQSHG